MRAALDQLQRAPSTFPPSLEIIQAHFTYVGTMGGMMIVELTIPSVKHYWDVEGIIRLGRCWGKLFV